MKITLISTATFPSDQGIRTISAVLKKAGHEVKIVFMTYSEDYTKFYEYEELKQLFKICESSDLIGISSYASTAPRAVQIIKFLERKKIKSPIVWGGVHATISPEDCIKHTNIVCVGEGEGAIIDLVDAIKNKKSIDKVKNLWIKKNKKNFQNSENKNSLGFSTSPKYRNSLENNEIIKNPVRPTIENLDEVPFADYDIKDHYVLENHSLRKFKEKDFGGAIFFLTGRGCPYGCTYCSNNVFNELYKGKCKKIVRWHSANYIIDCILSVKTRFKTLNYFDIRDDTFSLRPLSQIKEFCDKYKEKVDMRFKCLGDPHTISDDKIKLLVNAGCTDIIVGIQGAERTNLKIYKRHQKDKDVLNAADILSKYKNKLAVMYDVITCNPYEKPEDVIAMIKLLQKLPKPYFLSVNNLVFFPGSGLYNMAMKDALLKEQVIESAKLNYWDRSKHILLKKKNMYLVLILNLMRGSVTESRFGAMPNFLINFLTKPSMIKYNLRNPTLTYVALSFMKVSDIFRERIAKPIYRSMPLDFKVWYDKVRYRV